MIHTTFNERNRYESLNPRFAEAFEALMNIKKEEFSKGRHEVKGDEIFVNAIEYDTKPEEKSLFEAHREYIDVMLVLDGEEFIGYTPLRNVTEITQEYTPEVEAVLGKIVPEMTKVHMQPGDLCILFPEDAHAPGMECGGVSHVKKLIAKVKI